MAANIGINLLEVDGKATPSIQGAATSRAAFIGGTKRGVPGVVRMVTSFTEFTDAFGGFIGKYHTPYSIKGFFDNGGSLAYVYRAFPGDYSGANPGAAKAQSKKDNQNLGVGAFKLRAGYRGQLDPGTWGNDLKVDITYRAAAGQDPASWDLAVKLNGKQVEYWSYLPIEDDKAKAKLNDEYTGSSFIMLESITAASGFFAGTEADLALTGGADVGAVGVSTEAALFAGACTTTALTALQTVELQLLTAPDLTGADLTAWVAAAKTFSIERGDCMFVTHTDNVDDGGAATFGGAQRAAQVYGAAYWPWIRVQDPLSGSRWIPPTGHVMGVMARTDHLRGVWKAPAGVEAEVRGVLDIRYHISDTKHTNLVKSSSVNAIRFIPGSGVVVDSARTLSTNALWQFVNVRLLFNFVKSSLKNSLRWVVYEPNDEFLWNKVRHNSVTPFLMGLWRRGAFGPGAPDDVFTVKIDKDNNKPADIQQGVLNLEVYFYPSRPAETFIITVGQQEGGASANEG